MVAAVVVLREGGAVHSCRSMQAMVLSHLLPSILRSLLQAEAEVGGELVTVTARML